MITWGTRHATMRLPRVSSRQLAAARKVLSMSSDPGSAVRRVTGRRNRLLAYALWERNDRLCQRCGLEIDPTLHGYLPGALTIGHRIPVSLGGSNDPGNLGPEHRRCNLAAGNRPDRPQARPIAP